jgi:hypothetical protein
MNKNKLMHVFDLSYNETMIEILSVVSARDDAKKLLGLMYEETWDSMTKKSNTIEMITNIFQKIKLSHGIMPLQTA